MTPKLLDLQRGALDRTVFVDRELYELELERIFAKTWVLLTPESAIANPGDYVQASIGEDPVVVSRSADGSIHAFLNSCSHRGNKVCQFERGNTETFVCPYHGWRYDVEGRLTNVPFHKGAYRSRLDFSQLGLRRVARVQAYGGLVFGCWDADAPDLENYFGDAAWYLDNLVLNTWSEGLECVSHRYSYTIRTNWKTIAANASGDHYHTMFTHGSLYKLGLADPSGHHEQEQQPHGPFVVSVRGGHTVGSLYVGEAHYERDLAKARKLDMSPEVIEYIHDRYRRKCAAMTDVPAKPYKCSFGLIFPTTMWSSSGGALDGRGIYTFSPRGTDETVFSQWLFVDRDAPQEVKDLGTQTHGDFGQLATGFFGQDDAENYERIAELSHPYLARQTPLNISMGLGDEGRWPDMHTWQIEGLPGQVGPGLTEHAERAFYQQWMDTLGIGGSGL
ncbi:aromatic ring-hydroxylating oxygenase subunit alpha [Nocardia gipuzkoensis]|uniref:aromatic ring-hydroxylating oxygenase subunit alpha n=1 Tax=Nocardia gipuzkoensis TaxID=2749991 RepID=UPI00237E92B6|nr:aromatic ring-hydroxylating dioxygenase subunit alpha [Nocardia gipuzkoensis]MDE1675305.1 aromatic ring-hydroxylating dioxygenase subunit alpha [Nocardia gipuzkoensis]